MGGTEGESRLFLYAFSGISGTEFSKKSDHHPDGMRMMTVRPERDKNMTKSE